MPAFPPEIHVKRKATDDPVELLHIQDEGNNIRRARQYVFKRQRTSRPPQSHSFASLSEPLRTKISTVGPSDVADVTDSYYARGGRSGQKIVPTAVTAHEDSAGDLNQSREPNRVAKTPADNVSIDASLKTLKETSRIHRRLFHLSRDSVLTSPKGIIAGRVRRPRGSPAIFVEQRRLPMPPPALPPLANKYSDSKYAAGEGITSASRVLQMESSGSIEGSKPDSRTEITESVESSGFAAEMRAHINQEPARKSTESYRSSIFAYPPLSIRSGQASRFNAKPQISRSRGRHLEQTVAEPEQDLNQDEVMADAMEAEGDDQDYVMDVYVRMPAQMFELEDQKNSGLLVLDNQPDIDEFYDDESTSESDTYDDDEEDENAENHPSHDYPDEEDDFKDDYEDERFDYRDQNAFDINEFDDEMLSSDDESKQERVRRPWLDYNAY